jgi:hypothetical protein
LVGLLGGVAVVLFVCVVARAAEEGEAPKLQLDPPPGAELVEEEEVVVEVPDRWVGLGCQPVPEVLRAQLPLDEGQGLLVELVAEDSPAEEAGFQRHDVLATADGKVIGELEDLVGAVEAAGDKKMIFGVFRGGEKMTIEVTPAERPEHARATRPFRFPDSGVPPEWKEFEGLLERPLADTEDGRSFRFRFYGPGAILPPRVHVETPLPGNVTVTIIKKGGEPAKILVTKNGDTWEVTADNLDELPAEIRGHVKRMLGREWEPGPGRLRVWDYVPDWIPPRPFVPRLQPKEEVDKRLDDTNRRLKELEKQLEELKKGGPESETKPKAKKRRV